MKKSIFKINLRDEHGNHIYRFPEAVCTSHAKITKMMRKVFSLQEIEKGHKRVQIKNGRIKSWLPPNPNWIKDILNIDTEVFIYPRTPHIKELWKADDGSHWGLQKPLKAFLFIECEK